ncbi:Uncharacterized protein dnm_097490 [Desulfonema magnum]|uniref:Uncharacterized protein n=1 Tax=Desulfonema magnum TaxID=45655 RepID=A0A975GU00_9BACT|nr:Uncharacterized protein dnm_097490 [Desulfonema magnum]
MPFRFLCDKDTDTAVLSGNQPELNQIVNDDHKYLSKSFLYIFLSANGGEIRLFPSRAGAVSAKVP